MFNILAFTAFLILSPAFGLLDDLLKAERNCYSGCNSNYAASVPKMEACKRGCNYKLQNEICPDRCRALSIDEQLQASCIIGCSMFQSEMKESVQNDRQKSALFERLRQDSSVKSVPTNANSVKTLLDTIMKLKENSQGIDVSHDLSKLSDLNQTLRFSETVSLSELPVEIRSRLTNNDDANVVAHLVIYQEDETNWVSDRFRAMFSYLRDKWSVLFSKQSTITIFLIHSLFLSLSASLCYMTISLCRHSPRHQTLSIQAQGLAFDDVNEKEEPYSNDKIQSSLVEKK